ncbi:metallophosphoesterase [Sphingomonas jatrophae]|uniref:Calcineurin-like phosphoesterase domain-containing protein n=1 Tax=Sphingomonas jatrophae TaxID=1166337 RepID=A0A1I6LI77_9SPHN|nr:metallophosphoesterase [Sphingomonas jatrophae]SFS03159.1 hypothetical protein SAMN05192580_2769 [Sphingomonas jatrophae]
MLRRIIAALLLVGIGLTGIAFLVARQTPAVHAYRVGMVDWPEGTPPLRLVMLSDTHVGSAAMPRARLDAIVDQVNALRPDCVLLGGDYIEGYPRQSTVKAEARAVVAPFARLRPRLATIAVAGNHDMVRDRDESRAMRAALARIGARPLDYSATRCGPLTVAGFDHPHFSKEHVRQTAAAATRLGGPVLLLSHSPEHFEREGVRRFPLMVAGHTHCGQIAAPFYGAILTASVDRRLACGLVREGGRVLIVGPGLGTSGLPLRLFTRPEILLIEVGPRQG